MKETSEKIAEEKMSVDTGNTGDVVHFDKWNKPEVASVGGEGWRRDRIGRFGGWDRKKDDELKDMESEIFKKEKSTPPKWSCDNGYNH